MSEILSEGRMTAAEIDREEMRSLLGTIAGDKGSEAEKIGRVARILRLGYRRAKGLWYGEARRIEANELEMARTAAREAEARGIHAETQEIRARLARVEAFIAMADQALARAGLDLDLSQGL